MDTNMQDMFDYIKKQIKILDIFKIINTNNDELYRIKDKLSSCDKILVFGTGGSSLGGKCLIQYHCYLNNIDPRVIFVENVDSRTFLNIISRCNPDKTGIIVISKSGKTTETLSLFLTLYQMWENFDHSNKTVIITEYSDDNPLLDIAKDIGAYTLEHHKNIGGRFSVFSNVGLLPALLNDVNINMFLGGAKIVIKNILETEHVKDCGLVRDICMLIKMFDTKYEHVLMAYSDGFVEFGKWYSQLLSESLGKDEFGITPIPSIGTIDQHSLLQLFLGGPRNKVFTIITQNKHAKTVNISSKYDLINGKTIADMMIAHQNATIESIKSVASVRTLNFDSFDIDTLGFLMVLSFVEIISIAKAHKINPFDQPSVEIQKQFVKNYLFDSAK